MELMQNQKEQWSGVVKRAEETGQNFQEKSLSKCGKWNEFDSNGCFRVREYNYDSRELRYGYATFMTEFICDIIYSPTFWIGTDFIILYETPFNFFQILTGRHLLKY